MWNSSAAVHPRMKCVMKVVGMPGVTSIDADLCMFGLAGCDQGSSGFINASVRTIANARQVATRRTCIGSHRYARFDANDMSERVTGTWVYQVAQAMEQQLKEDEQEVMTREWRKKAKDAKRIRGVVHENVGTMKC